MQYYARIYNNEMLGRPTLSYLYEILHVVLYNTTHRVLYEKEKGSKRQKS